VELLRLLLGGKFKMRNQTIGINGLVVTYNDFVILRSGDVLHFKKYVNKGLNFFEAVQYAKKRVNEMFGEFDLTAFRGQMRIAGFNPIEENNEWITGRENLK